MLCFEFILTKWLGHRSAFGYIWIDIGRAIVPVRIRGSVVQIQVERASFRGIVRIAAE